MKNLLHPTVCTILLFFLCSASWATAQESAPSFSNKLRVGFSGGATYNDHPGILSGERGIPEPTMPGETVLKPRFGYSIGITANYLVTDVFSLSSRILYATHPGSGTSRLSSSVILPDPDSGSIVVDQIVQNETDVRYTLLEVAVLGKARLLQVGEGGGGVAFGLSAGYPILLEDNLIRRLVAPADSRFQNTGGMMTRDSGRVLVVAEHEDRTDESLVRWSLQSGLFYDFPLFHNVHLTPGLYFDYYGLTQVMESTDWTMHSLMLQLDITMGL